MIKFPSKHIRTNDGRTDGRAPAGDVSGYRRWIVPTTETYLLLTDTMLGDGKYAGS